MTNKEKRILNDHLKLIYFLILCILVLIFLNLLGDIAKAESCSYAKFIVTYYSNTETGNYGASGKKLENGDLACDRKYYKFGQKFIIGGKTYKCFDTGKAIKGKYRLDVFVKNVSVKTLNKMGKKQLKVKMCKEGK